ncbi:MAG: GGDEF domain-containing protein [Clostridia bacterium]|nr:GGDEF domain-containing protein [Clostridia bacterium]
MKYLKRLKGTYKRINTVGTWISVRDAAEFVGTIVFVVSLIFFLALYYMVSQRLGYDTFTMIWNMSKSQLKLFAVFLLFIVASTSLFTALFIRMYDMIINTPVNQLFIKMRNMGDESTNEYLVSGKISNPFKKNTADETWMDMVQNYLDVSSAEKYIDELTGCFNRKYFTQFLVHYMSTQMLTYPNPNMPKTYDTDTFAVFQVDIDHFKRVNDDFGHDAGDAVLREVGKRLRDFVGEDGIVVRTGGEEFVVVICKKFPFDYSTIASSLNQLFRDNIVAYGPTVRESRKVTCSIGFVSYPLYGDKTIELTFQDHVTLADIALYKAKEDTRDMWYEVVAKYKPDNQDLHLLLEYPEKAVEDKYIEFNSSKMGKRTS